MHKALLFDDLFAFCDFVRLHGSGARSKSGYRLYHLEHPINPRRTLLALVGPAEGEQTDDLSPRREAPLELQPAAIRTGDGRAALRRGKVRRSRLAGGEILGTDLLTEVAIRRQSRESTLLALVRPQPWTAEPEELGHLLFWLRRDRQMAPLVTASLRLGNDRMRYAAVAGNGSDDGAATVLRIEEPSYFLVQQVVEDLGREVELYYPAAEDLYLPWGLEHPLAELWRQSEHKRQDAWIFFRRDGSRRHVEPPRWRDVYDATRFEIDLGEQRPRPQAAAEHRPAGGGQTERFVVRLELVTRSDPGEPELWLLGEADRPRLEALIAGVDEEDLADLALSVHRDSAGCKLYVVREKRGRKRFLELGGRGFAAYKGFANLYLPVDRELLPQLRRDRYRDLFGLRSGELALVCDDASGAVTLYRLDESAFEPLGSLIDYLAAEADEPLEALVKASVFDLGPYLRAPSRSGLKPLGRTVPEAGKQPAPEAEEAAAEAAPDERQAAGAAQEEAPAEEPAPDPETREIRAERALLAEGQSFERWLEVLEAKLAAGKHEDAAVAFADTLWLAEDDATAGPLFARWHRFLGGRQAELQDEHGAYAAATVLNIRKQRRSELDAWLANASHHLRAAEGRMRIKQRWLLWREILSRNQDVRRLARLREEIRGQLSEGLSQAEMPAFLRLRLFDDSRFGLTEGEDSEAAGELVAATLGLDALARGLRHKTLGDVVLAVVARAYARTLGRADRAQELAGDASTRDGWMERLVRRWRGPKTPQDLDPARVDTAHAWHALYCAHVFELEDPGVAAGHRKRYGALRAALAATGRDALDALDRAEASLERREKIDNPAAFLSAENAERYFPKGGARASGELGQLLEQLRGADVETSLELLAEVFDVHLPAARSMDLVDLAELLEVTLEALARVRWESGGLAFLRRFESVADELGRRGGQDRFYFALKNSSLARGLTELGHEQRAAELVAAGFDELAQASSPIDAVDGSAALLNAVEGLALARRPPLIRAFVTSLGRWLDSGVVEEAFGHLSAQFYRLVDQAAEAAVSKEKLALGLFRRYQQQDEFLILDRILRQGEVIP